MKKKSKTIVLIILAFIVITLILFSRPLGCTNGGAIYGHPGSNVNFMFPIYEPEHKHELRGNIWYVRENISGFVIDHYFPASIPKYFYILKK